MGIEHHNQPETLSKMVETSNLVFSFIFTIEMLMKIAAFGLIQYISDGFNVFDGLIVMLRYKSSRPLGLLNSFSTLYYLLFKKIKMTHFWSKMARTGKLALVLSYRIISSIRSKFRSFSKKITNCTNCAKLHALNAERI